MPLVMYRLIFMLFYLILNFFHDDNRLANNRNRYLCHFNPIIHDDSLLVLVNDVHR
uniref:Uncharacterized protein n=2 Tax=Staphylococcus TaxID=1279 RepID=M1XI02_STAAU|nr:hypothetical protein [Staphylococcus hominis subsp. hominis]CCP89318.1 hypothetical protein [Staphylococcus aureus]CCP89697.1 hypothetical protein [Staphylococcus aureus]CCP89759.1 hypothetical protein [Staphylococcus aureus]CCP89888.1 hypothetical protein [Staphylococcus aureus]